MANNNSISAFFQALTAGAETEALFVSAVSHALKPELSWSADGNLHLLPDSLGLLLFQMELAKTVKMLQAEISHDHLVFIVSLEEQRTSVYMLAMLFTAKFNDDRCAMKKPGSFDVTPVVVFEAQPRKGLSLSGQPHPEDCSAYTEISPMEYRNEFERLFLSLDGPEGHVAAALGLPDIQ